MAVLVEQKTGKRWKCWANQEHHEGVAITAWPRVAGPQEGHTEPGLADVPAAQSDGCDTTQHRSQSLQTGRVGWPRCRLRGASCHLLDTICGPTRVATCVSKYNQSEALRERGSGKALPKVANELILNMSLDIKKLNWLGLASKDRASTAGSWTTGKGPRA